MIRTRKLDRKTAIRLLKWATHMGALVPLALLLWDYQQRQLGVDPVREITLRTGGVTLILLVMTLAVTPVNILFGWKQVLPLRKLLGLYTFLYVSLHLLSFVWLDYLFDLALIVDGIIEQRYVLVGFAAFLLLVPLAATSNKWAMRRLGQRWKRLHQMVYLIGILAVIHFLWLVKNVYTEPLIYGAIVTFLLLTRVQIIKQRILGWRRGMKRKGWIRPFPAQESRSQA